MALSMEEFHSGAVMTLHTGQAESWFHESRKTKEKHLEMQNLSRPETVMTTVCVVLAVGQISPVWSSTINL
jgi:hypothetical protein